MAKNQARPQASHLGHLEQLTEALRRLPGVGPKTALRMTYHLLQHDREGVEMLGHAMHNALKYVHNCKACSDFTDQELCEICNNPEREASQLCIVETPSELRMIEQTHTYKGLYYVLMGRLSPIDGMGPKEIGFQKLLNRLNDNVIKEVILATNFHNEGEATAHYIAEHVKAKGIRVSRIARGVPVGGELEYVDLSTLARAFLDRR